MTETLLFLKCIILWNLIPNTVSVALQVCTTQLGSVSIAVFAGVYALLVESFNALTAFLKCIILWNLITAPFLWLYKVFTTQLGNVLMAIFAGVYDLLVERFNALIVFFLNALSCEIVKLHRFCCYAKSVLRSWVVFQWRYLPGSML